MFLKIIINFDNGFKKKIYTVFSYFIIKKKNRIKMFLKIIIKFYNDFIKKFIRFFCIL